MNLFSTSFSPPQQADTFPLYFHHSFLPSPRGWLSETCPICIWQNECSCSFQPQVPFHPWGLNSDPPFDLSQQDSVPPVPCWRLCGFWLGCAILVLMFGIPPASGGGEISGRDSSSLGKGFEFLRGHFSRETSGLSWSYRIDVCYGIEMMIWRYTSQPCPGTRATHCERTVDGPNMRFKIRAAIPYKTK